MVVPSFFSALTRSTVPAAGASSAANAVMQSVLANKQITIMIAKIFFLGKFPFCFFGTGSTIFCYDSVSISYRALQMCYKRGGIFQKSQNFFKGCAISRTPFVVCS
jgi:hypothetical protein